MAAWATIEELGVGGALSYAAHRAAERLPGAAWHRYRLVAVPVAAMPAMPRGFTARALPESAIDAAALALPDEAIRHRLDQGMTCLAAERDGRLLGATWLTQAPFDEDEAPLRFVPPPACCWDTGLYVLPEHRGGRAFAALWAGTAAWMRARELEWSMSRIADYNLASLRSHARMGARGIGVVTSLGVGRFHRAWGDGVQRDGTTVLLRRPG